MHSNTILQDIVVFLKQAAGTRSYVPVYIDRQGDSGVRPVFVVVVVAVGSLVKIVSPQQFAGGHNRSQFYIVRNRLTAGCSARDGDWGLKDGETKRRIVGVGGLRSGMGGMGSAYVTAAARLLNL
jgi:hypothetical protein